MQDPVSMPMRFGAFVAPFHWPEEDPNLAIHDDLEFAGRLESWGFDEVWYGEHHSGGAEIIASPEMALAYLAATTTRIKLGTGVLSLPYHNPMLVADRFVLLDILSRGRAILGVGPGALVADARQLGVDPQTARDRMEQYLQVVRRLLAGETVTYEHEGTVIGPCSLHVLPTSAAGVELAVAGVSSDSGPMAACQNQAALISSADRGKLRRHWLIWSGETPEADHQMLRRRWRIAAPVHIAATRDKAFEQVRGSILRWFEYFQNVTPLRLVDVHGTPDDAIRSVNESGFGLIGDSADLIEFLARLANSSGGFGTFLATKHSWVSQEDSIASYRLISSTVMPICRKTTERQVASARWLAENSESFLVDMRTAIAAKTPAER